MTNPLTSLDELIWKQFEKVTQYAHQNYGWDKWDSANVAGAGMSYSLFGSGIYGAIMFYSTGNILAGTVYGTLISGASIMINKSTKTLNISGRSGELSDLLRQGAARKPSFGIFRPIQLFSSMIAYTTSSLLALGYVKDKNLNIDTYKTAGALAYFTAGTMILSFLCLDYFRTQLPTPPSAKKPFWKTTYEGIRNKLKPRPQLEPAVAPAPQYVTIDTLIA